MAFTCGFFNSQNGDRKYNAEQMASIFDGLIKDGVYDTVGDIFAVTPGTGMQVLVGSGRAWFDHTWNNNDAQYPLAITAADVSLPRYDAVVLETNHSDTVRTNRLRVLTGTPASNPVKPTMTSTANVKQHPLAYIRVTAGATAITQSMIQVVVGTSECPFVTGIIDTAQIDALFQQWNGEFNEWFENLKAQLSDNIVANLQGQIDQKVAKADVATAADIEAGTSTTKWVTPKGLKESNTTLGLGDIKHTFRTDLGNNWVLCNGDIYSPSEYPDLYSLTPSIFTGKNWAYVGSDNPSYDAGYGLAGNEDVAFVITEQKQVQAGYVWDIKNRNFLHSYNITNSLYCSVKDVYLLDNNTLIAVGQEYYGNGARIFEIQNVLATQPTIVKKTSAEVSGTNTGYGRVGYNRLTGQCAAVMNENGKLGMAFRDGQGNWTITRNIASITAGYKSNDFMAIKSDGSNWVVVVGSKLFLISSLGALLSTTTTTNNGKLLIWPNIVIDNNEKHVIGLIQGTEGIYDSKFTSWGAKPVSTRINPLDGDTSYIWSSDKVNNEYVILAWGSPSSSQIYTSTNFSNWTSRPIGSYYATDGTLHTVSLKQKCMIIKNYMVIGLAEPSKPNIIINAPQLPESPYDQNGYNYIKVK